MRLSFNDEEEPVSIEIDSAASYVAGCLNRLKASYESSSTAPTYPYSHVSRLPNMPRKEGRGKGRARLSSLMPSIHGGGTRRLPVTRAMARSQRLALLDSIPDELLHLLVLSILEDDLPGALALRLLCRSVRERLEPVLRDVEARRLRWDPELTHTCDIVGEARRSLVRREGKNTWAACQLLPSTGRSSWVVRIDRSANNRGRMIIGVCDSPGLCGWGVSLMNGRLVRWSRRADGMLVRVKASAPPPDGFPDGHGEQVLVCAASGAPWHLKGRAEGTTVQVILDATAGTLGFCIDGGAVVQACHFPARCALRPWARLFYSPGDAVTIGAWLTWTPADDEG